MYWLGVSPPRYVTLAHIIVTMELSGLSRNELEVLAGEIAAELARRPLVCVECGVEFSARAGARTCSTRCRVALHRKQTNSGD